MKSGKMMFKTTGNTLHEINYSTYVILIHNFIHRQADDRYRQKRVDCICVLGVGVSDTFLT